MPVTDFPTEGDDKAVSLRNSQYPQFDYEWAVRLRDEHPDVWNEGGMERGTSAFTNWGKARDGDLTEAVTEKMNQGMAADAALNEAMDQLGDIDTLLKDVAAENGDQQAADASVAVQEGMDGFELRVDEGHLDHGRQIRRGG